MALTTYSEFEENFLVRNGMPSNDINLNKAPKQLKNEIDEINSSKQVNLVSGTSIKTINGSSILGSGNLEVNTNNQEIIKFDTGTTEGVDLYTFNGASTKTIDIKAGTNINLSKSAGSIIISANDSSVDWSEITSKPTTVDSYGITDVYTKTEFGTLIEFTTALE